MALLKERLKIPEEWYLVKVINFNGGTLKDMRDWLTENIHHTYKELSWSGGCSSKVGVAFESAMDAVLFRLRYS
jgi:hypothetical protein